LSQGLGVGVGVGDVDGDEGGMMSKPSIPIWYHAYRSWTRGWMGVWTQFPSFGISGIPPIASRPPACGLVRVGRERARLKIGGMEGVWNLGYWVSSA